MSTVVKIELLHSYRYINRVLQD